MVIQAGGDTPQMKTSVISNKNGNTKRQTSGKQWYQKSLPVFVFTGSFQFHFMCLSLQAQQQCLESIRASEAAAAKVEQLTKRFAHVCKSRVIVPGKCKS